MKNRITKLDTYAPAAPPCQRYGKEKKGLQKEVGQEVVPGGREYVDLGLHHGVAILVQEALALVLHLVGKVPHDEGGVAEAGLGKEKGIIFVL